MTGPIFFVVVAVEEVPLMGNAVLIQQSGEGLSSDPFLVIAANINKEQRQVFIRKAQPTGNTSGICLKERQAVGPNT